MIGPAVEDDAVRDDDVATLLGKLGDAEGAGCIDDVCRFFLATQT